MSDLKLNFRQKLAADLFASNGWNALAAMIEAGYAESFARARCGSFFKHPQILAYLSDRYHPIAERCGLSVELAIKRLVAIADADITQVASWDENGMLTVVPSEQLTPEQTAIIETVEQESVESEGGRRTRIKIRVAPVRTRIEALRELRVYMQAMGMMSKLEEPKEVCRPAPLMPIEEAVRVLHRLGRPPIDRAALLRPPRALPSEEE